MCAAEIAETKSARWGRALEAVLAACGKSSAELAGSPKGADWKIAVARTLRSSVAPPFR